MNKLIRGIFSEKRIPYKLAKKLHDAGVYVRANKGYYLHGDKVVTFKSEDGEYIHFDAFKSGIVRAPTIQDVISCGYFGRHKINPCFFYSDDGLLPLVTDVNHEIISGAVPPVLVAENLEDAICQTMRDAISLSINIIQEKKR